MIPWTLLDTAQVPGGGGKLRLMRRGTEFSIIAELVPAVLAWARNSMVEVFGDSLTDPRVSVCEADVGHLIRTGRLPFDAIVLDVDNGPQALTRESNDRLYDLEGLSAARSMLRSGGVLAVWSSGPFTLPWVVEPTLGFSLQ